MFLAGASGCRSAILVVLICTCNATYSDYSGSHMPQYADYEEPRESAAEDYRQPPEAPGELDSKYDEESRDKNVHTYKNRHEVDEHHETVNRQEDDKKAWSADYIETYNDNPSETLTKSKPKARFFKKRPRLRDEKQGQDEFRHRKNDESRNVDEIDNFDDDMQNDRLKNNNFKHQNKLYKHQPDLDEMNPRHKFIHKKNTNKIIRRKPRDRQRSRYDTDKEIEKPSFDLDDMSKLKAGNLLEDGALVPKPVKLNPQYDYYDISRIKDIKDFPNRRMGVTEKVRGEKSEVQRSTTPNYRRRGPDLDSSEVTDFTFLRGGADLEKKINEVDHIRKYLNEGLKDRGEMKTELKKGDDEPINDEVFDISEHIPSDIEDIKQHLALSLNKSSRKDIELDKSRDFIYDISDDESPKSFLVDTEHQSTESQIKDILTRTRPPYRRMEESDSHSSLSEIRPTQKATTKKPATKVKVTKKKTTTVAPQTKTETANSSELSLAEKSRLSILKKVMRKESVNSKTTMKPPVLMQVMNGMNTMVMVEPPSTIDPWKRAREVSGDTKERLKQVKRLMRRKLVSNAKDIHELTENWDDMICDYVDMSLVRDDSYLFKGNLFIVIFCCIVTVL